MGHHDARPREKISIATIKSVGADDKAEPRTDRRARVDFQAGA
jgi:hypothetical protein